MSILSKSKRLCGSLALLAVTASSLTSGLSVSNAQAEVWSGGYVGATIGARWLDPDWTTEAIYNNLGVLSTNPFSSPPNHSFDFTSFSGGIFAGYNWLLGSGFVGGLEADIGYAGGDDALDRIPGWNLNGVGGTDNFTEVESTWNGSLRLRGGFEILENVLLFGTGGIALQQIEATAGCNGDANFCAGGAFVSESTSMTLIGWTVGAGVETVVHGNWLARLEYGYSDFSGNDFTAIQHQVGVTNGFDATIDASSHDVGFSLIYRFN